MGKIRKICWVLLLVFVLSGCAQESGPQGNGRQKYSQPQSGRLESSYPSAEPEDAFPADEQGSFILDDGDAVYACGNSRMIKINKRDNHLSVLWDKKDSGAAGGYGFSEGRALLLRDKIYFMEVTGNAGGLGDCSALSVINRDGTGYSQVDKLDGFGDNLFVVDGILYVTYYDRVGARGETVSAYSVRKDGSVSKIEHVYEDTPYQYMPMGYRESCVPVPESLERYGYMLLFNKDRQLVKVEPENGTETVVDVKGYLGASNGDSYLSIQYAEGKCHLYLIDGVSLQSEHFTEYGWDMDILGMDSEYVYARMTKWEEGEEERYTFYRTRLSTGGTQELFTLTEMDAMWQEYCFYPYMAETTIRGPYIYYTGIRDYKLYLMRRDMENPGQEEVMGEAYYDSGISHVGSVENDREKFFSPSSPRVLMAETDLDRLVLDGRFPGAGEINRYLLEVQEKRIAYEKNVIERLGDMDGSVPDPSLPVYSYTSRVSEIFYFDGTYISFYQSEYDYQGGAHGMPYWTAYTFDLRTGKRLFLEDIIDNSGKELRDIITGYYAAMVERNPAAYWEDAVSYVRESDGYETGCYLTRDGIRFYYPPYALACFAAGFQEATIPYREFRMKIPVGGETDRESFP